jgi:hypothetical protein
MYGRNVLSCQGRFDTNRRLGIDFPLSGDLRPNPTLTYAKRQNLMFCRDAIDREVIYRADDTHPEIRQGTGEHVCLASTSARDLQSPLCPCLGLLFWEFPAGLSASSIPDMCLPSVRSTDCRCIQAAAPVNVFYARREPKAFGFDNWFDGRVLPDMPVLMVDDIAASAPHRSKLRRVRQKPAVALPILHRRQQGWPRGPKQARNRRAISTANPSRYSTSATPLRAVTQRALSGQRPN